MKQTEINWDKYGNPIIYSELDDVETQKQRKDMTKKDKLKLIEVVIITSLILLFAMFFTSCEERKVNKAPLSKQMELDKNSVYSDQNYKVFTLEGCEYIVSGYGNQRWGSHKGNCKNPIHNEKK